MTSIKPARKIQRQNIKIEEEYHMEKTLYNLHGIISTVITPFKEDGSVDYDSLAK